MAVTAIWNVKGWIGSVLNYTVNPEKTENPEWSEKQQQSMLDVMEYAMQSAPKKVLDKIIDYAIDDFKTEKQYYVTGINCDPATARNDMILTKRIWGKEGGNIAYHGYQSFKTGEVSADKAHQIGVELAQALWGDRFEVIVSTHLNTKTVHNHFVLNSVSFVDGLKYYDQKKTYQRMRDMSDALCEKYHLSVIENPVRHGRSRAEWETEKNGRPTWMTAIRLDLDAAIMGAVNFQGFVKNMRERGYEVEKRGRDWRIKPQNHTNFSRLRRFGEKYTEDAIIERIIHQRWPSRPPKPEEKKTVRRGRTHGDFRLSKVTWNGLRALYYFYRRKLQEACRQQSSYTPYVLREDIRHLEAVDKQFHFLFRHKIDTAEELTSYRNDASQRITIISEERKELKNELRRIGIPEQRLEEIKTRIGQISAELRTLRQDVKLCDAIAVRSLEIAEKNAQLKQIEEKEVERKREQERKHGKTHIR